MDFFSGTGGGAVTVAILGVIMGVFATTFTYEKDAKDQIGTISVSMPGANRCINRQDDYATWTCAKDGIRTNGRSIVFLSSNGG
ncbi:MAG: hypothetical protein AAFQ66_04350 [Pseudomonadota bacterium]